MDDEWCDTVLNNYTITCNFCFKKYTRKDSLKRHLITIHKLVGIIKPQMFKKSQDLDNAINVLKNAKAQNATQEKLE